MGETGSTLSNKPLGENGETNESVYTRRFGLADCQVFIRVHYVVGLKE